MKVLMSAFACCPGEGSEEGVGWNWANEVGKLGHEVVVLTQTRNRAAIEAEVARNNVPSNVTFDFMMPGWLSWLLEGGMKIGLDSLTHQVTHMLWQFAAYAHVRRTHLDKGYDIVHHITYGGIRHPTLLGRTGIPLVLGPVGGGERAPFRLRRSYPLRGWIKDLVRDIHTWSLRFDPITLTACRDALAIYVPTPMSRLALPKGFHHKTHVHIEIGVREKKLKPHAPREAGAPLKLIYAGRLLYWKGMGLGIRALAEARRGGANVTLTMVGSGPEERHWRRLVDDLGLGDAVTWAGWIAQSELDELYRSHDALLFPSLHDSSGNVVLEAFNNALPVICLDLGGPAEMADDESGRVVPVEGRSEAQCVTGLAAAITELAKSPEIVADLAEGARKRVRRYQWADVVASLYSDVTRRLGRQGARQIKPIRTVLHAGNQPGDAVEPL